MSDLEVRASDRGQANGAGVILAMAAVTCMILLPFVPLVLAGLESATLGTRWVEGSCEQLGIHDELSSLYEMTILRWFK